MLTSQKKWIVKHSRLTWWTGTTAKYTAILVLNPFFARNLSSVKTAINTVVGGLASLKGPSDSSDPGLYPGEKNGCMLTVSRHSVMYGDIHDNINIGVLIHSNHCIAVNDNFLLSGLVFIMPKICIA